MNQVNWWRKLIDEETWFTKKVNCWIVENQMTKQVGWQFWVLMSYGLTYVQMDNACCSVTIATENLLS